MKTDNDLNQETNYFLAQPQKEVVDLTLKGNALLFPTLLRAKAAVFKYLDLVEKIDSVKVIVITGFPEKDQLEEYFDFYSLVAKSKISKNALLRMFRAYDQFMMKIMTSQKVFIYLHAGKEIFQILNMSLAADYRIAAADTEFYNPSVELGLVTKGGGGFFLNKRLGHRKTVETLLFATTIPAREALELGLVDKVVRSNQLKDVALQTAHKYGEKPSSSLSLIKRLLNHDVEDLSKFLELENKELLLTLQRFKSFGPAIKIPTHRKNI